jgi:hypothetical protein
VVVPLMHLSQGRSIEMEADITVCSCHCVSYLLLSVVLSIRCLSLTLEQSEEYNICMPTRVEERELMEVGREGVIK